MSRKNDEMDLERKSFTVTETDGTDQEIPILQRIELPLIWARLTCGARIVDLREDNYNETLQLFKDYFMREEVLCNASNLIQDEDSVESMADTIRFWMKDSTSLVALMEGTKEVVGAIICRVVNKLDHTRTFSRIRLIQGKAIEKIMNLRSRMMRMCDVFELYNTDEYFRIYAIVVKPQHRGRGIGNTLMICSRSNAEFLGQTVMSGIFTDYMTQILAKNIGMESKLVINYSDWLDNNNKVVFEVDEPNKSANLMAVNIT